MIGRVFPEVNLPKTVQILVVEDERVVARDIKVCLENLGYTVAAIASSGIEAIEKAQALHPDVILMDIRLEGEMDGTQAAQQIWDRLNIPVIYSTGYSDHATVERATATEPFGYILKPIKERELYVAVKTALQRHQLETKLKEREQWLATVLRAIGDGVIVVDPHGHVRFLNMAAEALTGWQQQDAIDRPIAEVLPLLHEQTRQPLPHPITQVLQTGTIAHLTDHTLLVTKKGSTLPIADRAAPFTDDTGKITGAVLVFRDITEHRLAEERNLTFQRAQMLEHQMAELQRLNQLKEDFLSTVSHEMRTPIANIEMVIQMLEVTLDQQNQSGEFISDANQMAHYLQILREQCNQELSLVNDLLELQQVEAGAYPLEQTAIDLMHWIPHLIEVFQQRANADQQHLQVILPAHLPVLVTDLAILTRICTELLTNACKYTPPKGTITVSVEVVRCEQSRENQEYAKENKEFTQAANSQFLQIKISNTGVEVPADELSRIFDKFYRILSSKFRGQDGTGLGLALIKRLTSHLGGSIWAESGSGQTDFIVELPLSSDSHNG